LKSRMSHRHTVLTLFVAITLLFAGTAMGAAPLRMKSFAITAPEGSAGFFVHPPRLFISGQIEYQWQRGQPCLGMIVMPVPASPAAFIQQWKARQQAEDRASREFSEYIRGTENYHDPSSGHQVELPGGHEHVWGNSLGEYMLSNDAGFDPNRHSSTDWVAIEPVR
jgi:hypothetical protein